jgi:hypothetical protein
LPLIAVIGYFQCAAEPLFNSNHVDAAFRMDVVFPECLIAPAFLNALLYSVIQTSSRGRFTSEGLQLQGKALQYLRQSVLTSKTGLSYSDIGAIMILHGVAASPPLRMTRICY